MKVLIIWDIVPEQIKLYVATGANAELALKCHNRYIGGNENDELMKLNNLLPSLELIGESSDDHSPIIVSDITHVVSCGAYL